MSFCLQKTGPNEKPLQVTSKHHLKLRRVVLGIIGFCCILFVISTPSDDTNIFDSSLIGSGKEKGTHPFAKCSVLKQFQICSHRLLEPPNGTRPGSTAAMTAFWNRGIRCFDIDSVTTKDGQLIAAHPMVLGPRISPNSKNFDPSAYTLEDMRRLGADEEGYPILDTILDHYASLVNSDETTRIPYFSESSEYVQGSLFHLDLKGPNLTAKHMNDVQDKLLELGIQNNVAVCAGVLRDGDIGPGFDILKHLGQSPSKSSVCLVLRDIDENDQNVDRLYGIIQKNKAIRSIASSYKFEKDFFSKIRGMPIITWTIDTEETLTYSIECGAAGVVTNHPMKLHDMLQGWIKNGQCTEG